MPPQDPQSLDDLVSQLVNNQRASNSNPPPQPKPAPAATPSPSSPSSPPPNLPGTSTDAPRTGLGKESAPLRTMQSDLDLLKKSPSSGPTLSKLPKMDRPAVTPTPKPPVTPMPERTPLPATPYPVQPSPRPSTPPPVFKAPTPYAPPVIRPPVKPEPPKPPVQTQQKPSFSIPSSPSNGQPKKVPKIILFTLLGALAAMGIGVYFYISNQSGQVIPTPTPTATVTKTPTPSLFEIKFGKAESISIPVQGYPAFLEVLKSRTISSVSQGQLKAYKLVDEQNNPHQLGIFLGQTGTVQSVSFESELNTTEWVLVLYGHYDETGKTITRPFIAAKINNSTNINQLLSDWSSGAMTRDLASIFTYNQNLAKNAKLVSDSYKNIQFKYAKIPNKDFGVAYAVFEGYLVIASSRDSFRAAVDALMTPPGK